MAEEEFEEEAEEFAEEEIDPDEIDPEELDDELVDDEFTPLIAEHELVDVLVEEGKERGGAGARVVPPGGGGDDDGYLADPDDVEADLDTILKDRLVAADDE